MLDMKRLNFFMEFIYIPSRSCFIRKQDHRNGVLFFRCVPIHYQTLNGLVCQQLDHMLRSFSSQQFIRVAIGYEIDVLPAGDGSVEASNRGDRTGVGVEIREDEERNLVVIAYDRRASGSEPV